MVESDGNVGGLLPMMILPAQRDCTGEHPAVETRISTGVITIRMWCDECDGFGRFEPSHMPGIHNAYLFSFSKVDQYVIMDPGGMSTADLLPNKDQDIIWKVTARFREKLHQV